MFDPLDSLDSAQIWLAAFLLSTQAHRLINAYWQVIVFSLFGWYCHQYFPWARKHKMQSTRATTVSSTLASTKPLLSWDILEDSFIWDGLEHAEQRVCLYLYISDPVLLSWKRQRLMSRGEARLNKPVSFQDVLDPLRFLSSNNHLTELPVFNPIVIWARYPLVSS